MIRASRLAAASALAGSLALHALALAVGPLRAPVEIEGGAQDSVAMRGNSFADMVEGTARPVAPTAAETPSARDTAPAETATPSTAAPVPAPEVARPVRESASAPGPSARSRPAKPSLSAEAAPVATTETAIASPAPAPEPSPPTPALRPAETAADDAPATSPRPDARPREVTRRASPEADPPRQLARRPAEPSQQGNADQTARRGATTGRDTATAARASSGPAQSAADGNAAAANYPGQVMRKLSRVRRPSVRARGSAVVAFTVAASGGLSTLGLARSSGSADLDRAALRLVRSAAPFPRPPAGARRTFSISIEGR